MTAVAVGGSGLVAVGWEGHFWGGEPAGVAAVWTSPDGLSWVRVPHDQSVFGAPDSTVMTAVAAAGPGLVAVGYDAGLPADDRDAAVWTSSDGLSWTRVGQDDAAFGGPAQQSMTGVTAGGPGVVAVGYDITSGVGPAAEGDAAVWVSSDGLTWDRVDTAGLARPGRQVMQAVAAGGPGLVAVGFDASAGEWHPAVWTSGDAMTWTQLPDDGTRLGTGVMLAVAAGGPGLVAVGHGLAEEEDPDAAVWLSVDGITWTRVPHEEAVLGGPGLQAMNGVTAAGSILVAVGSDDFGFGRDADAAVWVSQDGARWVRVPRDEVCFGGPGVQRMLGVAAAGPGVVAAGEDNASPSGVGLFKPVIWVSPPPG